MIRGFRQRMSDGSEWSRDGGKKDKEPTENEIVEAQILAEAEAIVELKVVAAKAPYDLHLKFLGKKASDINQNLKETNEHLSWLSFSVKLALVLIVFQFFLLLIIYVLMLFLY